MIKDVATIRDAQRYIADLYENEDRDFSYIFGYAARHVGYLSKRLTQGGDPKEEFVRSIAWILAIANKIDVDAQNLIVSRYPKKCPYCLTSPCQCRQTNKKPASGIPAHKIPDELFIVSHALKSEAHSFSSVGAMLRKVYPNNQVEWDAIGAWKHTTKLSEELAEVHEAYSRHISGKKPIAAVEEELADLFAWLVTAWELSDIDEALDDCFIQYFLDGCPLCGKHRKCVCNKFLGKQTHLVDPAELEKLRELFVQFATELGTQQEDIEEIESSLRAAEQSQNEPMARTAVLAAKAKVEQLEKGLSRSASTAKDASTLAVSINKILEAFGYAL